MGTREKFTEIMNLNGTVDDECGGRCKSWIDHWQRVSKQRASMCLVHGCVMPADGGAHIHKVDSQDGAHYIVPMCTHHNNQRDTKLLLDCEAILVSVKKGQACDLSDSDAEFQLAWEESPR